MLLVVDICHRVTLEYAVMMLLSKGIRHAVFVEAFVTLIIMHQMTKTEEVVAVALFQLLPERAAGHLKFHLQDCFLHSFSLCGV